jgi:hypothetical protein
VTTARVRSAIIPENVAAASVRVRTHTVSLTNLDKIFWPALKLTKLRAVMMWSLPRPKMCLPTGKVHRLDLRLVCDKNAD